MARGAGAAIYGGQLGVSRPALVRFTQAIAMVNISRLLTSSIDLKSPFSRHQSPERGGCSEPMLDPGTTLNSAAHRTNALSLVQLFSVSEGKYFKQNTLHEMKAISELTKLKGYRCEEEAARPFTSGGQTLRTGLGSPRV